MMEEGAYKPILEQLKELKLCKADQSYSETAVPEHTVQELNDYIRGILPLIPNDELSELTAHLRSVGVDEVRDMGELEECHLTRSLKPIHVKKLLAASAAEKIKLQKETKAKELLSVQPQPTVINESSFEKFGQIVPQVVHTLPEAQPVIGVASLDDELYVLRDKEQEQVEVYNTSPTTTTTTTLYNLLRRLSLPGVGYGYLCDMALCRHNRCLYIADCYNSCVHRVELDGNVTKWPVINKPLSLSVTSQFSVLVTSTKLENLFELTTEGKPLPEIKMRSYIFGTHHIVQLSNGQFVVCNGYFGDPVHRVCIVDTDGHVTKSYGGPPGSAAGELNEPHRVAVDKDEFIFVADYNNSRVLLLSPTLQYAREILSRDQLKWKPEGLFVDDNRRLLYVADGRRVIVVQL